MRYMWQRVYIDGSSITEANKAATNGATRYKEIDPTQLISEGRVNATLSNIVLGYPPLPSGAIPAT
ncbi:hypothetical protein D3C87_1777760 [compost metagenome]